jgi:small subunit ribosomal protein S17
MSDIVEKNKVQSSSKKKNVRTLTGFVVSEKMAKTIAVSIEDMVKHPVYGKYIRRTTTLFAHDADNVCNIGDRVLIKESRPISRKKNWVLMDVIEKAQ